jgi:hypothetical protein
VTALVAAEVLKLRTTRGPYAFAFIAVALTGAAVAGTIASARELERRELSWQLDLVSTAGFASLVALMLGVTLVTTEWRHGTITPAFLTTPVRPLLIGAKTVTAAIVGAVLTLLCFVVVAGVAIPWLTVLDVPLELGGDTLGRATRILLAGALYGAFGAAVGVLVHSQVVGIVGVIVWILVVESLVTVLLGVLDVEGIADVLPGRALSAFDGSVDDGLEAWTGGLVALLWTLGVLAAGTVRTERSDVT